MSSEKLIKVSDDHNYREREIVLYADCGPVAGLESVCWIVYDVSARLYCVVRAGTGAKIGFIIQQ